MASLPTHEPLRGLSSNPVVDAEVDVSAQQSTNAVDSVHHAPQRGTSSGAPILKSNVSSSTGSNYVSGKFSLTEDRTIWRELHQSNNSTSTAQARRVSTLLRRAPYMVSCRLTVLEYTAQVATTLPIQTTLSTRHHDLWEYYIAHVPSHYSIYTTAVSAESVHAIARKFHQHRERVRASLEDARLIKWYELFSRTENDTPPPTTLPSTPLPSTTQPPTTLSTSTPVPSTSHLAAQPTTLPRPQPSPPPTSVQTTPPLSRTSPNPHSALLSPTISPLPRSVVVDETIQPLPIEVLPPLPPTHTTTPYTFTLHDEAAMCCVALRYRHSQHLLLPRNLSVLSKTMQCTYAEFRDHINLLSLLMIGRRNVQHSNNRAFTAAEDQQIVNSHKSTTTRTATNTTTNNNASTPVCGTIGTCTPLPLCILLYATGRTPPLTAQACTTLSEQLQCSEEVVAARRSQLHTLAVLDEVRRQEEGRASEVSDYRIGCTRSDSKNSAIRGENTNVLYGEFGLPYTVEAYIVREARRLVTSLCAASVTINTSSNNDTASIATTTTNATNSTASHCVGEERPRDCSDAMHNDCAENITSSPQTKQFRTDLMNAFTVAVSSHEENTSKMDDDTGSMERCKKRSDEGSDSDSAMEGSE